MLSVFASALVAQHPTIHLLDCKVQVSPELAAEADDTDFVVLEGMGRSIETNLWAAFKVDSLKIAMAKHPEVAQSLRARMYDAVINYAPAGKSGREEWKPRGDKW